jgi:hypothetical protein
MKKFTILLLALCSFTAQAQITTYNNAAQNTFYGIGGYSYTKKNFPNGVQASPYVVTSPAPQNDFSFAVSATGGFNNVSGFIVAANPNTDITIKFFNNNVRKFGSLIFGVVGLLETNDIVNVTATTNLGATQTVTNSGAGFVGFNVTGVNEYLVSITATFQTPPSPAAKLGLVNVIFGDNSAQNAALNFDGINDYVALSDASVGNFGTNQDFTVMCWIKPDAMQPSSATNPDENDIISKWAGLGAGANNNYPFVIRYLNTTRTTVSERGKILVGQWDGTTFTTIISNEAVNDGNWHHVAFVRGATGFSLYIDGALQGSAVADNVNGTTTNTTLLQIGRRGNVQNYFKGEIDEVRIFTVGKTFADIQNAMFCRFQLEPNLTAFFKFSNGVPHGDNSLITQVPNIVGSTSYGTLNNFAQTGDASNFVMGQVKYVKKDATGSNNGSSWTNAFTNLQSALTANTCNDLFDVYVAKNIAFYKPSTPGNANASFIIPSGMRVFGGLAGTEKSINQRNMALIHSTNETTLSGDLTGNDSPFNFATNRSDNSQNVIQISGNNALFDGFTVRGSIGEGGGLFVSSSGTNSLIKNNKFIDNEVGLVVAGNSNTISNSIISGNQAEGVNVLNATNLNINNSLIANNGSDGISFFGSILEVQSNISNCTIASNGGYGMNSQLQSQSSNQSELTNNQKNAILYDNASGGIASSGGGTIINNITYSLVQGITTGTGNLNGNTANPQFAEPLANTIRSATGEYQLRDSSPCINVGDDVGVSPLDLDRNLRPKGGKTDMGAYESSINLNEIISIANGNWETTTTWNLERIPLPTDKVILNGHQVMVTTNTARAKELEYKAGGILRYLAGGLLRFGL